MNPWHNPARIIRTRRMCSVAHVSYLEKPEDYEANLEQVCAYYPCSKNFSSRKENMLHVLRSAETNGVPYSRKLYELGSRRMIEEELFREEILPLKTNKVFCSQWISDEEVVMGTKCNKLMVYNTRHKCFSSVMEVQSSTNCLPLRHECGIHAIAVNPSGTLLVTGGPHSNDTAVYTLPGLEPVCVGEGGHRDWVFDIKWIDDEFFISGARDGTLALWNVNSNEPFYASPREYYYIRPVTVRVCKLADKVRALNFRPLRVLTAMSTNSYLHKWDLTRLQQVSSHKLPYANENVCLCPNEDNNMFAVGSAAHVTFIDSTTYRIIKSIRTKRRRCSVRSLSFRDSLLTIGTGVGLINFYDLRAGRFLDSYHEVSPPPVEPVPRWFVDFWHFFRSDAPSNTAIYTHCYDHSGTRFFAGGGPLTVDIQGCYAALFH